jgi:hypothetical protein
MQHFLRYGHPLSIEEYENMSLDDTYAPPIMSPTMDQFKEQVGTYALTLTNEKVIFTIFFFLSD